MFQCSIYSFIQQPWAETLDDQKDHSLVILNQQGCSVEPFNQFCARTNTESALFMLAEAPVHDETASECSDLVCG